MLKISPFYDCKYRPTYRSAALFSVTGFRGAFGSDMAVVGLESVRHEDRLTEGGIYPTSRSCKQISY